MEIGNFLSTLWPDEIGGWRCIAFRAPKRENGQPCLDSKGEQIFLWLQRWFDNTADAAREVAKLKKRQDVQAIYHGNALFSEKKRQQGSVKSLGAFWLDIDCGQDKPYPNKHAGLQAVQHLCQVTGLPSPTVVDSGGGWHCYWWLEQHIPLSRWQPMANALKALCETHGIHVDGACTADAARVLRPVGTTNHKRNAPVELKLLQPPVSVDALENLLAPAIKPSEADPLGAVPAHLQNGAAGNDDLRSNVIGAPPSVEAIKAGCAQVRHSLDTRGSADQEPVWHAILGILRFCEDGKSWCHVASSGHPGYDRDAVEQKVDNWGATGASTCERFRSVRPALCEGCRHAGQIKSPIKLGFNSSAKAQEAPLPQVHQAGNSPAIATPELPPGFVYTQAGLCGVVSGKNEDGDKITYNVLFSRKLFWPIRATVEEGTHLHVIEFALLQQNGKLEMFSLPAAHVPNQREIISGVYSHGVSIETSPKARELMVKYITEFVNRLYDEDKVESRRQLGWNSDKSRFASDLEYGVDGTVRPTTYHQRLKNTVAGFDRSGTLDRWKAIADMYNRPGMEAYQFAMLYGLGSVLLAFLGDNGPALALTSTASGQGKSTAGMLALSWFCNPKTRVLKTSDTAVSWEVLRGQMKNFVMLYDELTEMVPQELADFVYDRTQITTRVKGDRLGGLAEVMGEINSGAIITSNNSIRQKLADHGAKQGATQHRLFEVYCESVYEQNVDAEFADLADNYGLAGDLAIRAIISNAADAKKCVLQFKERIKVEVKARPEERFWLNMCAVNMTAWHIANSLGLINYNGPRLMRWMVNAYQEQRRDMTYSMASWDDLVAEFLVNNTNRAVVVHTTGVVNVNGEFAPESSMFSPSPDKLVNTNIVVRAEVCTSKGAGTPTLVRKLSCIYIDKQQFDKFLRSRNVIPRDFMRAPEMGGLFVREPDGKPYKKWTLAKGLSSKVGAQANAYGFDMTHELFADFIGPYLPNAATTAKQVYSVK